MVQEVACKDALRQRREKAEQLDSSGSTLVRLWPQAECAHAGMAPGEAAHLKQLEQRAVGKAGTHVSDMVACSKTLASSRGSQRRPTTWLSEVPIGSTNTSPVAFARSERELDAERKRRARGMQGVGSARSSAEQRRLM